MTNPYKESPTERQPEGFYRAKDVRLFPPMLSCFGKCRQMRASELPPDEEIFAFWLEPFGMGYTHIECMEPEHLAYCETKHKRVSE